MPRLDKTGPMGVGPMTGRGFGPCGMGMGLGRRFGLGRRMGRGFGWGVPQTKKDQLSALSDYKKALLEELKDIDKEEKELGKRE